MKPTYALFLDRCGLTIQAAAEFHGCSPEAVRSYRVGRRPVPPEMLAALRELYQRIERASRGEGLDDLPEPAREAARGLAEIRMRKSAKITKP